VTQIEKDEEEIQKEIEIIKEKLKEEI